MAEPYDPSTDGAFVQNNIFSRAGAWDAYGFNASLSSVYTPRLVDALRYLHPHPQALLEAWDAELSGLLALVLHHMSEFAYDATFGGLLYNMVYRVVSPTGELVAPSTSSKLLHVVGATAGLSLLRRVSAWADALPSLFILGPLSDAGSGLGHRGVRWLLRALLSESTSPEGRARLVGSLLRAVLWVVRAASLLNTLVFLRTGRFVSLWDRVVGFHLVRTNPRAPRYVALHFMDRALGWIALAEAADAVLPLINIRRARTAASYAVSNVVRAVVDALPDDVPLSARVRAAAAAWLGDKAVVGACVGCGTVRDLHPWKADGCGHTGCYYCLAGRAQATPPMACPRCGGSLGAIVRNTAG